MEEGVLRDEGEDKESRPAPQQDPAPQNEGPGSIGDGMEVGEVMRGG